ncbi:Uncharacterised protein [Bordetella pertussis]|nr:Uncharacterised protein [Bordetella pertussis]
MTRTSRAMASSILRKLSACCSALVAKSSRSSLDRPSTSSATSGLNFSASSCLPTPWSSITSCSRAADSALASSFQPAQISVTAMGWEMYGAPLARNWPRWAWSAKR